MLRGANIICLAAIDWAFNWQIPQEVAAGLAAAGNRVLFVENTGVRRPHLKDLDRLLARLRNWRAAPGGLRAAGDGVDVLSPMILPLPYARWAQAVNQPLLLGPIARWLGSQPTASGPPDDRHHVPADAARARDDSRARAGAVGVLLRRSAVGKLAGRGAARRARTGMFAEADLVLTTSSGLLESARPHARRAVLFQGGVRACAFQRARAARGDIGRHARRAARA